jgi:predicted lipoprotein with Yx(FWY)xxD motif
MRIWIAALLVVTAAVLAGCGGSSSGSSNSETVISTRQEENALVLVDDSDHTLYTFSGDSCGGQCADEWHPMLAKGDVVAESDSGLESDLLGKTERSDGQSQVTYDGKPLYLYTEDGAGQITGTGSSFGGVWRPATTNPFKRQTTTGVSCEPNCDY